MIRNIIIVFVLMIIVYIVLLNITPKEHFCDTVTDTSYNQYQDVLSDSQMAQITQMINNQSTQILSSAGGIIPGPRGKQGPPGPPGSKYVSSGFLYNGDLVLDNNMSLKEKNYTTNQIWYLLEDGRLVNKYVNNSKSSLNTNNLMDTNAGGCLNSDLKLVSCNKTSKWDWNNLGQLKADNGKCITNKNNKVVLGNCGNSTLSSQKWIIN